MTVYRDIRRSRRLVVYGIVLGYVMAIAILVIRIVNTGAGFGELLGSIAVAMSVAIAPTLAWLSLDRRPGLLHAAGLAALITGLINLVILPVALVIVLIWRQAWSRRPVKAELSGGLWWGGVALAMGSALAVFVLFAHLDPVCSETLVDGTVVEVSPAEHGLRSGWNLGVSSYSTTSSQFGPDSPVATSCSSDTVSWAEGLASIAVSLAVMGVAARRWPVNGEERRTRGLEDGSSRRPTVRS